MDYTFLIWAFLLGGLSAASLPLGSVLGIIWRPQNKIIGMMTAFGGGALLAALAIELVAPTAMHLSDAKTEPEQKVAAHHLINLMIGAISGGVVFILLDEIINSKGGFLRKTSSTIEYFTNRKAARRRQILEHLSVSELIRHLPLEAVEEMVSRVTEKTFNAGEIIFEEGTDGDTLIFLEAGRVTVKRGSQDITTLKGGDVLGEIALVTGAPRTATVMASETTVAFSVTKDDFDIWRARYKEFEEAANRLAASRLKDLVDRDDLEIESEAWVNDAMASLIETSVVPTETQLKEVSKEHGGAPLAIWLGIMLDGIPESFVIGSALLVSISAAVALDGAENVVFGSVVPYTLIAGLFLANFPEALSSSIGMKKQGWSGFKIFSMWFSLTLMTSLGAAAGFWFGDILTHSVLVLVEGFAAGAMLTMIAAAMIPEAIHLGGRNATGLAILIGFLSTVGFKLLE